MAYDRFERQTRYLAADDGTRIAWHEHRSPASARPDRPTVLLSNGIFTTENFWRFLVEALVPDHRVIHWDYRGHGMSEPSRSGDYSQAAHARDLERVTVEVTGQGGRPPIQLGFSMAVSVLCQLYARRPDLFPAIVFIAGSPDAPFSHAPILRNERVRRALSGAMATGSSLVPLIGRGVEGVLRTGLGYPIGRLTGMLRPTAEREDIDALLQGIRRMEPIAWWNTLRDFIVVEGSDAARRIDVPTLIIAARRDVFMPLSQVRALRDAVPGAEYEELADAGHAGLVEAGPRIVDVVRRFLRRVT